MGHGFEDIPLKVGRSVRVQGRAFVVVVIFFVGDKGNNGSANVVLVKGRRRHRVDHLKGDVDGSPLSNHRISKDIGHSFGKHVFPKDFFDGLVFPRVVPFTHPIDNDAIGLTRGRRGSFSGDSMRFFFFFFSSFLQPSIVIILVVITAAATFTANPFAIPAVF